MPLLLIEINDKFMNRYLLCWYKSASGCGLFLGLWWRKRVQDAIQVTLHQQTPWPIQSPFNSKVWFWCPSKKRSLKVAKKSKSTKQAYFSTKTFFGLFNILSRLGKVFLLQKSEASKRTSNCSFSFFLLSPSFFFHFEGKRFLQFFVVAAT